jgi:hypothetical protein
MGGILARLIESAGVRVESDACAYSAAGTARIADAHTMTAARRDKGRIMVGILPPAVSYGKGGG